MSRKALFASAFRTSIPVLLGYLTIGFAFGLLLSDAGYPWWLAPLMSVVMYAGAAQFIALGLFAAGASLWEAVLITAVVNIRHAAYGMSMLQRFRGAGRLKPYLVYSLTDETFALLSSLPEEDGPDRKEGFRFMFLVALLDQAYWVLGSLVGAAAGSLIPFKIEGLGFALTALFVVLMVEQMLGSRRALPFIVSALAAAAAVFFLPERLSLLGALAAALAVLGIRQGGRPC